MVIGGLVRGATDVLMVLFAEARLDSGGGAAGLLGVGMGVGAIMGAVGSAGLIGRPRIASYLVVSAALFALTFIVLSGVELLVLGMVLFACFGLGESLLRVTSSVGTQRLAPDAFLARIFGVVEGLQMAAMALGSIAVSMVVQAMGLGPALVTMGSVVALTMTFTTFRFRRAGGDVAPPPAELIDRLLHDDVFRHLPGLALARLAGRVREERFEPGQSVITEGEIGDRYYLITSGRVVVTVAGEFVREMGPGQAFGEIALIRDLPRTATVTCAQPTDVLVVERDDFLEAVTGHPRTLAAASDVAAGFMSGERG
jgi:MFS family permease